MEDIGRTIAVDSSGLVKGVIKKVRMCRTSINGVMRNVKLFEVEELEQPCPKPTVHQMYAHNVVASGMGAFSSAFSKGFSHA